jgi:hypothetical protein
MSEILDFNINLVIEGLRFIQSATQFCYTLYKNPVLYEIEEIENPLIDKGFKSKVVSPRIELGSSV